MASVPSFKKVLFYKEGDDFFQPINVTVTEKKFGNIDALLEELTQRVPLPYGVRNIYTSSGNRRLENISEIEHGSRYLCSSKNKIKRARFGSRHSQKKPFVIPRPPSNTKYRPVDDHKVFQHRKRSKMLTIVAYENSQNMTRYVLPSRVETLETVLQEISSKLKLNSGPVHSLVAMNGQEVSSCEELREGGDTYVAHSRSTVIGGSARSEPAFASKPRPEEYYRKNYSAVHTKSSRNKLIPSSTSYARDTPNYLSARKTPVTPNTPKITTPRPPQSKKPTKKRKEKRKKDTLWLVTIKTSDIEGAYSDNTAFVTLYGDKGKTSEYHLGVPAHTKAYFKGSTNEAEIKVEDVGKIFKIRIGHDDDGASLGWHIENIILTNLDTNDEYFFECDEWLSRDKGDGEVVKEFSIEEEGEPVLPTVTYEVTTHTSDCLSAGTDAMVSISIVGERGDSGKRELLAFTKKQLPFQRGSVDMFHIKAVSLGTIQKVSISHNNIGESPEWYLDKIVIKDTSSFMEYVFPCDRWIGGDEEKSEVVLKPQTADEIQKIEERHEEIPEEKMKWNIDDHENELCVISKLSENAICYNTKEKKFHAAGESNDCCKWKLVKGMDTNTRLLRSIVNEGYLAIDEERVVLTKGNPGLLNEFYIAVNEEDEVSLESIVYSGIFLGSDDKGHVAVASGGAPEKWLKFETKGCLREGNHIQFYSVSNKQCLVEHEDGILEFHDVQEEDVGVFEVVRVTHGIRAFKNVVTNNYICGHEEQFVDSSDTMIIDKKCWFNVQKAGHGVFFKFESHLHPGMFLSKENDKITLVDNNSSSNTMFRIKVSQYVPFKPKADAVECAFPSTKQSTQDELDELMNQSLSVNGFQMHVYDPSESSDEERKQHPERPRSAPRNNPGDDTLDSSDGDAELLYRDEQFFSPSIGNSSEESLSDNDDEEDLRKKEEEERRRQQEQEELQKRKKEEAKKKRAKKKIKKEDGPLPPISNKSNNKSNADENKQEGKNKDDKKGIEDQSPREEDPKQEKLPTGQNKEPNQRKKKYRKKKPKQTNQDDEPKNEEPQTLLQEKNEETEPNNHEKKENAIEKKEELQKEKEDIVENEIKEDPSNVDEISKENDSEDNVRYENENNSDVKETEKVKEKKDTDENEISDISDEQEPEKKNEDTNEIEKTDVLEEHEPEKEKEETNKNEKADTSEEKESEKKNEDTKKNEEEDTSEEKESEKKNEDTKKNEEEDTSEEKEPEKEKEDTKESEQADTSEEKEPPEKQNENTKDNDKKDSSDDEEPEKEKEDIKEENEKEDGKESPDEKIQEKNQVFQDNSISRPQSAVMQTSRNHTDDMKPYRPSSSPTKLVRLPPLRTISALQSENDRPLSSGRPPSAPTNRPNYNSSNTYGDDMPTERRAASPTPTANNPNEDKAQSTSPLKSPPPSPPLLSSPTPFSPPPHSSSPPTPPAPEESRKDTVVESKNKEQDEKELNNSKQEEPKKDAEKPKQEEKPKEKEPITSVW